MLITGPFSSMGYDAGRTHAILRMNRLLRIIDLNTLSIVVEEKYPQSSLGRLVGVSGAI